MFAAFDAAKSSPPKPSVESASDGTSSTAPALPSPSSRTNRAQANASSTKAPISSP